MRIVRFADLIERKYNLKSEATVFTPEIKRDLIRAYNGYVNAESPTVVEPVLQLLADAGEPVSAFIIKNMQSLIANLDHPNQDKLSKLMLDVVNTITPESKSEVFKFIDNNTKATTEAQRNYRRHLKSKFDTVTRPLVSIVSKVLGKEKLLPQQRKDLSKEKLLIFMRTPAAQQYGFDSLEVLTELLAYPPTREKLTTLINAIDRNKIPKDGPEIANETAAIKALFDQKQTNEPYFEAGEDEAKKEEQIQLVSPQEQKDEEMRKARQEMVLDQEVQAPVRIANNILLRQKILKRYL